MSVSSSITPNRSISLLRNSLKRTPSYRLWALSVLVVLLIASACSTQKNRWINRKYHDINAHYNGYFNAKESVKEGVKKIRDGHEDNFQELLPIFIYSDETTAPEVYPEMNVAIEKCSKVIQRHSMYIKRKEHCSWIDDSYFVIAKANFWKREFGPAEESFKYVSKSFKEEPTRYDAMLWLARTYIEMKAYDKADRVLSLIESEKEFPKRLMAEYSQVYADLFIRQKNYEDAIFELKKAVEMTRNRRKKTRMMYILAQLYQKEGEYQMSSGFYAQVLKRNPPYQMAFYARINRALAFDTETGNSDQVRRELRQMLRDDKNIEFQDQIYYALAELDLAEELKEDAIDHLKKGSAASISNNNMKGLICLKLADIYFEEPDYKNAQKYYDSTVTFLENTHPDYEKIKGKSLSLNDLVNNLNIIAFEDSVQALTKLSKAELNDLIDNRIQDEIDAKEAEQLAQQEAELNALQNRPNNNRAPATTGGGEWYFYNQGALSIGFSEFQRVWGRRKNEDNWRRSDKQSIVLQQNNDEEFFSDSGDSTKGSSNPMNREFYTKDIPDTPEKLQASTDRIITAYYNLGNIYREQMEDYQNAIASFEQLLKRFPKNKFEVVSYYQLYRLYSNPESRNPTKARYYRDLILNNYPDTEYALIIRDPDSVKKAKAKNREVELYYESALSDYRNRRKTSCIRKCDESKTKYPANHLAPKFHLLKVKAMGISQGKPKLVEELKNIIASYPSDEVAVEAQNILNLMDQKAKAEAEAKRKENERNNLYSFDPAQKHDCVLIFPNKAEKASEVQVLISNFNKNYFGMSSLKVSGQLLDKNRQMVVIKVFDDTDKGMDYFRAFTQNQTILKDLNSKGYDFFVISYENFGKFYRDKDVTTYSKFFNSNYLKTP